MEIQLLKFLLLHVGAGHEDLAGGRMNPSGEEDLEGRGKFEDSYVFILDQKSEIIY